VHVGDVVGGALHVDHDVVAGGGLVGLVLDAPGGDRNETGAAGGQHVGSLVPASGAPAVPVGVRAAHREDLLRDLAGRHDLEPVRRGVGGLALVVDHVGAAAQRRGGDLGADHLRCAVCRRDSKRAVGAAEDDAAHVAQRLALDDDGGARRGAVAGDAAGDADDVTYPGLAGRDNAALRSDRGRSGGREQAGATCACGQRQREPGADARVPRLPRVQQSSLFLEPAGLAVGLALKELRYGPVSDSPLGLVESPLGSPLPDGVPAGIRQVLNVRQYT
jgi:hypothetical protein